MSEDLKKQEKEWNQAWEKEFNALCEAFVKKNIGHQDGVKADPPVCYKTGDNRPWCLYCLYRSTC
jgi:hypothetical protein